MPAAKVTPMRDYFRATGQQLREWIAANDEGAQLEASRRALKRAAKAAARKAAAA